MQDQSSKLPHLEGTLTLEDLLKSKRFQWSESVLLLADIADAVDVCDQEGSVDRGLTPSQIRIDSQGKPRIAKPEGLISGKEFHLDDAGLLESYAYLAPECLGGGNFVRVHADIYALGSMLYQLLTDRLLFVAKTREDWTNQILERLPRSPRTIDDRIPKQIEQVCLKCLEKNADKRYRSGRELANDLRKFAKIASAAELEANQDKIEGIRAVQGRGRGWRRIVTIVPLLIVVSGFWVVAFYITKDQARSDILPVDSLAIPKVGNPLSDAASGRGPRIPPPLVITDWKKFATKSELGVIKGHVGEWISTLNQPPKILLSPAKLEQSAIRFRPQDREVFVNTTELVLLELGEISEPNYDFRVTVGQNAWGGGIGLFVGYQDAQDMGPDIRHFHAIYLSRHDLKRDQLLGASLLGAFMTEQGGFRKKERNPILTPSALPAQEQILLVEVRDRHFHALRWGEQPGYLPVLQHYYRPTSYSGRFGLYFSNASGYLRNPQIRVVSKKP
jgi:serine/threonine protein kinase